MWVPSRTSTVTPHQVVGINASASTTRRIYANTGHGSGTSIETAYYGTLIGIKVPRCKTVRPGHWHSVRPKTRLTESGTDRDLITILRCFLKTVVTSQNVIVFKIKKSGPKRTIRVGVSSSVPRPTSCATYRDSGCRLPVRLRVVLRLAYTTSYQKLSRLG
jgi:hypothetical protein